MVSLSKITNFKFSRIFTLLFLLVFIVVLLQYVKIPKQFEVDSKVNDENSTPILFHSKSEESCLNKYLLDLQALFADPQRSLHLIAKNASQDYMFTSFHEVAEALKVRICIIEPSILHCSLPMAHRELLAKRNFNISNFTRSQHITTFGVLEEDVTVLQKVENMQAFRNVGIQPYFVENPIAPWMKEDNVRFKSDEFTSHIFFMYYTWTYHVVVFYKRNNYLWHAALKQDENLKFLSGDNLQFASYDSAYENFSFDTIPSKSSDFPSIYIPSSPHYFLFQIPSSRFLECNLSRAIYIETPASEPNSTTSSTSTSSEFNKNMLISLRELKTFFKNLLMNFWIHSGTLLGWYRQCDIIPYTSDVDFGAWASEIDDLDSIIKYFRENKILYIVERMGIHLNKFILEKYDAYIIDGDNIEEKKLPALLTTGQSESQPYEISFQLEQALEFQLRCNDLRVDTFFMYKLDNGTWASGHRPSKKYYFRYHYPFFTLCSAELLHEKVQVPCEAEDVISIEYGDQWMHPVSSWYYESSIHNRGPDIYWNDTRWKHHSVFESY